jgi:hypothetical protein
LFFDSALPFGSLQDAARQPEAPDELFRTKSGGCGIFGDRGR